MLTARLQTKCPSCLHWLYWEEKKKWRKEKKPQKTHKNTPKTIKPQVNGSLLKIKKCFLTEEERGVKCKPKLFYNLRQLKKIISSLPPI